jgi:hypothetical protein
VFLLGFPERRIKSALLGGPLEGSSHFFGAKTGPKGAAVIKAQVEIMRQVCRGSRIKTYKGAKRT